MRIRMWTRAGAMAALVVLAACGGEKTSGTEEAVAGTDGAAVVTPGEEAPGATGTTISGAEIRAYRLTPERLAAWHRMQMAVARAYAADPSLRTEDDEEGPESDADRLLAKIQGDATLRAAVAEAGLSPREAVVLGMALVNASMGMQLDRMGEPLPDEVSPENVAFLKAHRAELERMTAEREAVEERGAGTDGE